MWKSQSNILLSEQLTLFCFFVISQNILSQLKLTEIPEIQRFMLKRTPVTHINKVLWYIILYENHLGLQPYCDIENVIMIALDNTYYIILSLKLN